MPSDDRRLLTGDARLLTGDARLLTGDARLLALGCRPPTAALDCRLLVLPPRTATLVMRCV